VLYVAADPAMALWLESLNPNARSLATLYRPGVPRARIYEEMVDEILAPVRRGGRVCAAFYGHPGVVVTPSHEAIARARAEGYPARMLPAVSAEDCLIADLGVDPIHGWQSYEANALLLRRHVIDPTAALVVWQVDAAGKPDWDLAPKPAALHAFAEHLLRHYPPEHEVVFYNASIYPTVGPTVTRVRLEEVMSLDAPPAPTLFVPPLPPRPLDRDAAARLGLTLE
jgi:Tetrapyrrole (Corrin/Porphyrin) Methylases